jgi:hypothetical protein
MLGYATNINHAKSFAGLLIRKDYACSLALLNLCCLIVPLSIISKKYSLPRSHQQVNLRYVMEVTRIGLVSIFGTSPTYNFRVTL